jgi:hypothetical protein
VQRLKAVQGRTQLRAWELQGAHWLLPSCTPRGSLCEDGLTCDHGTCNKLNVDGDTAAPMAVKCASWVLIRLTNEQGEGHHQVRKDVLHRGNRLPTGTFCNGERCIPYVGPGHMRDKSFVRFNGLKCIDHKYHDNCNKNWGYGETLILNSEGQTSKFNWHDELLFTTQYQSIYA